MAISNYWSLAMSSNLNSDQECTVQFEYDFDISGP